MIRPLRSALLGLAVSLAAAGCCQNKDHPDRASAADTTILRAADVGPEVKDAVAVVHGTKGHEAVTGVVRFTDTGNGVRVIAEIDGLTPGAEHGFHVHEFGDLSDMEKGLSLGGHFNPDKHDHGKPGDANAHAGDMGNLKADDKGHAHLEVTLPAATISGKNALLGRGVVVHAGTDKFTQPVGDAGGRIGIAAIGIAQVKK